MNTIKSVIKESLQRYVTAYHGTPHGEFDHFSLKQRGTGLDVHGLGDWGNGLYFTPFKEDAINFAKKASDHTLIDGDRPYLYTVKLKMENPFSFDKLHKFNELHRERRKELGTPFIGDGEIDKIHASLGTTEEEISFMDDLMGQMDDNWQDYDIAGTLKEKGYDSIISDGGREYVVFDEDQVKIIKKEPILD